jgi:protein-S-isoprenylcysteine O-methyltransferase Ste14
MGTVSGGFTFGWQTVWVYAVIILMQGTGIWWISNMGQKQKNSKKEGFSLTDLYDTKKRSWREWVISGIYSFILVFQIVFTYFNYNTMDLNNIANAGWIVMTISAFFGWIPIFTFRKKGGVPKGKSYVHTTIIVDSGIYAIVRHPQFFAGILVSLALVLMSQHWLNLVLFIPVVVGTYIDSLRADKRLIEKFGNSYESYMEKVSGLNPLVGIFNLIKKRVHKNQVRNVVEFEAK